MDRQYAHVALRVWRHGRAALETRRDLSQYVEQNDERHLGIIVHD